MMDCNVAIVGAGMAGLGAATQLLKHGIKDISIFEANDKAGGRIFTLEVGNSIIDLGAQWVHGIDTELHSLAVQHNLIHPKTSDEGLGLYVRDDGYIFGNNLVNLVDFQVGNILTECENFVDAEVFPKSLGEYLEENFVEWVETSEFSENDKEKMMELYDWHVRFQLIDNCCRDLKQLSAKAWGKYSCLGKDGQAHINLKGGYQSLVNILVQNLPKNLIRFNTPITNVSYRNGKIILKSKEKEYSANFLIITPSIGVLKEILDSLDLPLPNELVTAIESMGFGGMGKVFLLFEKKWWNSDGFQLIWRRNSTTNNWTRHISGFDPVLDQPNMLLGWVSELGVKELEKLSEETIGEQCVDLLKKFLSRDDIPLPIKVYKTNWSSNKWIRGGYSHSTPTCDSWNVGPATLSKPVYAEGIPRVLFAGEATHNSHFSTTHGAYESGQQQANFLIKYFDSQNN